MSLEQNPIFQIHASGQFTAYESMGSHFAALLLFGHFWNQDLFRWESDAKTLVHGS